MRQSALADSGPLAARFNSRDSYRAQCAAFFKVRGNALILHTTWEVISEVMYFLDFSAAT